MTLVYEVAGSRIGMTSSAPLKFSLNELDSLILPTDYAVMLINDALTDEPAPLLLDMLFNASSSLDM